MKKIKIDHAPKEKMTQDEIEAHLDKYGWKEYHTKKGQIVIVMACPPKGCPPCEEDC